jgi:hypothetical protein
MSYNLCDNQDPRNLIKRCPCCDLIWFKTEGCDGETNCGNNNFTNHFDVSRRPLHKYKLVRIDGKLRWEKLSTEIKPSKYSAERLSSANINEQMIEPDTTVNHEQFNDYPLNTEYAQLEDTTPTERTQFVNDITLVETPQLDDGLGQNEQMIQSETKTHKKRMGCGTSFEWKQLPKIEDDLILQLFKVKTMEQAKQKIKEEYFTHMYRSRNKNIDSTFRS